MFVEGYETWDNADEMVLLGRIESPVLPQWGRLPKSTVHDQ